MIHTVGDAADDSDFDSLLRKVAAAPAVGFAEELDIGTVVAETFRIDEKIGAGGMGVVYLAHDERLDRNVAVKLPGARRGTDTYQRLLREARALARLNHENVLTVHEVGEWEGQLFIATEYVDGGTLRHWLAERSRDVREVVALHVKAGRGLAAAHAAGLVHRDFKPANVLVGGDGRVRVGDFGLAIDEAEAKTRSTIPDGRLATGAAESGGSEERLTQTGALLGTVGYIAPEIYRGEAADARSDQFSFCVSLWEAITGVRPFAGPEAAVRAAVCERPHAELPGTSTLPRWLRPVLVRGLSVRAAERFADMDALVVQLERGIGARRRIAALGAGLVLLGGGTWAALSPMSAAETCLGDVPRVDALWSAERRATVREQIASAPVSVASAAADSFANAMDGFVEGWRAEHREACEETRVFGHQSERVLELRMACLDRRWAVADSLVELVGSGGVETAMLLDAKRLVPNLQPCRDLLSLEGGGADVSVESQVQREQLAIRLERLSMNPSLLAGDSERIETALKSLGEVAEEAEAAGLRRIAGRALLERGELQETFATVPDATGSYERCMRLGMEAGYPQLFSHCAAHLVDMFPRSGMVREHAGATLDLAVAALGQLESPHDRALLQSTLAPPAVRLGRIDEAVQHATEAVEFFNSHVDSDVRVQAAVARTNLGVALLAAERHVEAADAFRGALELEIVLYGEDSLGVARARGRLANLSLRLGKHDSAMEEILLARRVLEDLGRAGTKDHVNVVSAQGAILERLGRLEEALAVSEEALRLDAALSGPAAGINGEFLGNVALMHFRTGDVTRATELATRSRDRLEEVYGAKSVRVVQADTLLGGFARRDGRFAEARVALQRAREVCVETLRPQDGVCINATVELATAEVAAGAFEEARVHAEDALRYTEAVGNPEYSAEAELALAKALHGVGRDLERAATLARTARDRYRKLGPPYATQVAAIEAWITESL